MGSAGCACVISLESAGCASATRCRARPAESANSTALLRGTLSTGLARPAGRAQATTAKAARRRPQAGPVASTPNLIRRCSGNGFFRLGRSAAESVEVLAAAAAPRRPGTSPLWLVGCLFVCLFACLLVGVAGGVREWTAHRVARLAAQTTQAVKEANTQEANKHTVNKHTRSKHTDAAACSAEAIAARAARAGAHPCKQANKQTNSTNQTGDTTACNARNAG